MQGSLSNIVTLFIFHVLAQLRPTLELCHFSPMWLFNHLREYQPEFCGKIDYTPNKVLPSAERQEVASLAANGLQSEGEMVTVIEMSVRCMPAACCTVLRSWGCCSGFQMGRDIPKLDHTKLCYGEHFNFSFESIRGAGVGISRPAIEKDVAADVNMILFTLLACIAIGLVLWGL